MREIKFRAWDGSRIRSWDDIMDTPGFHHWLFGQRSDITLMQYLGLKDKNGIEIYEGDIVQTDEASWKAQVIYNRGCFMCTGLDNKGFSVECNWENFEVIGNIYKNKDLLKE